MKLPEYTKELNIRARCPDCKGAVSTFERKHGNNDIGCVISHEAHTYNKGTFNQIMYRLFRCAGCGRGGLGKFHFNGNEHEAVLEAFHPTSIDAAHIPPAVPPGIASELREAELCASVGAWRAASALLRSTLEKTLKANGYAIGDLAKSNLQKKIDAAATDGIITGARQQKAHSDVRVLGNDVLHDEWREVLPAEVETAHHYCQRVLEDFYDDRPTVEQILKEKKRIAEEAPTEKDA